MKHGCAEDFQVPYVGESGRCYGTSAQSATGAASFGMVGWERLPENRYLPLMEAVVERGPVAVSAAAAGWTTYGSGIYDSCSRDAIIDHAVVLIGYGGGGANS